MLDALLAWNSCEISPARVVDRRGVRVSSWCTKDRRLLRQTVTRESLVIRLKQAPLAQLDRASGYEPEGREFESLRARHFFLKIVSAERPLLQTLLHALRRGHQRRTLRQYSSYSAPNIFRNVGSS